MQPYRNKMLAFFLNFIPGLGHYYMGRKARGIVYPMFFFGGILLGFMLYVASGREEVVMLTAVCALILAGFSMIDLIIYLIRVPAQQSQSISNQGWSGHSQPPYGPYSYPESISNPNVHSYDQSTGDPGTYNADYNAKQTMNNHFSNPESERFFTILLSFIPGLGHLHMGLMQRGLSFLIAFFGLGTVMFFLTGLTSQSIFMLFLGILPIIWLYCMFDAVQLIHRKQAGEVLIDRTLFDEMEAGREDGKRSKVMATLLSAFPGAGHMYLGLQKRGLQLMVIFLGSVYILDLLHLSLFLFLIPVIWFFSFFDGMQQTSRYGREPLVDRPIIEGLINHQRWLGVGLLILGIYYVSVNLIVPVLDIRFPALRIDYRVERYLKTFLVSILLIFGGIKLMTGSKSRTNGKEKRHGNS
ncbi:hypothetical protein JCM16418A_23020 [Paenibacillus pini]